MTTERAAELIRRLFSFAMALTAAHHFAGWWGVLLAWGVLGALESFRRAG